MKIQFIIHADFLQPGMVKSWVLKKGFKYDICRPFALEKLPEVSTFDWLVLMGGPQRSVKLEKYPYLQDEIELIKEAIAEKKTVLGFCLGAQLIGEALGAKAETSPNREVGIYPITLTEDGKVDPLLTGLPSSFPVIHWHNDMPGLTEKAKILAFSEGCPRQIVRYKKNVYGFQCHPEPTYHDLEDMVLNCPEDLKPGTYVQTKEAILDNDIRPINSTMMEILDRLHALTFQAKLVQAPQTTE